MEPFPNPGAPVGAADAAVRLALLRGAARPFASEEEERQHLAAAAKLNPGAVLRTERGRKLLAPPKRGSPDAPTEGGDATTPDPPPEDTTEHDAATAEHTLNVLKHVFKDDRDTVKAYVLDLLQAHEPFPNRDAERDFLAVMRNKYGEWGEMAMRECIATVRRDPLALPPGAPTKIAELLHSPLGTAIVDGMLEDPGRLHNPMSLLQPVLAQLVGQPNGVASLLRQLDSIPVLAKLLDNIQGRQA